MVGSVWCNNLSFILEGKSWQTPDCWIPKRYIDRVDPWIFLGFVLPSLENLCLSKVFHILTTCCSSSRIAWRHKQSGPGWNSRGMSGYVMTEDKKVSLVLGQNYKCSIYSILQSVLTECELFLIFLSDENGKENIHQIHDCVPRGWGLFNLLC